MNLRSIEMRLTALVTIGFVLTVQTTLAAGLARPNIVYILADDLGWTDAGCLGSKYYETPNIDRLRHEGMQFTNAYSNGPNCAPTRASLMSGQYGPRHGIFTVGDHDRGQEKFRKLVAVRNETSLPLGIVTMADAMHSAGYATGCFGKWHLGEGPQHLPNRRGFDVVAMRDEPDKHPATDFFTDTATQFIRQNADRPFFAYVAYHAVHVPLRAPDDLIEKYQRRPAANGHHDPTYAAMLEKLDAGVGRILALLDELKLGERTLVVFCSDNGGVGGYRRAGVRGARDTTDNAPLRGGKGMLYEGGIRIPMIVRWTGIIEPESTCNEPIASIDFYPTFLELSGAKLDASQTLDGVSLASLFQSSGKAQLPPRALFWHFPGYLEANAEAGTWRATPGGAIRRGDWKLLEFFETGRVELYNLREDLGETRDIASSQPDRAAQLQRELVAWRESVQARMPKPKIATAK